MFSSLCEVACVQSKQHSAQTGFLVMNTHRMGLCSMRVFETVIDNLLVQQY